MDVTMVTMLDGCVELPHSKIFVHITPQNLAKIDDNFLNVQIEKRSQA